MGGHIHSSEAVKEILFSCLTFTIGQNELRKKMSAYQTSARKDNNTWSSGRPISTRHKG